MCTVLSEPPQSPLLLLQPDHHMESRHREGQSIIESRTEWRQRRRRRRGGEEEWDDARGTEWRRIQREIKRIYQNEEKDI